MLAYLEGTVRFTGDGWAVIVAGGVGYKVYVVGFQPELRSEIAIHLYDHIREDRRELFGFQDRNGLELFEKMIDINGVGPKLAQKILNAGGVEALMRHILSGDVEYLSGLPGIGKKTAQKIVLELKGVLVEEEEIPRENEDAIEALVGLGYARKDVIEILKNVDAETTEAKIRSVLNRIGS